MIVCWEELGLDHLVLDEKQNDLLLRLIAMRSAKADASESK